MDRRDAVRQAMLEYASDPFSWGVLDCCQFAAKVAEKITGVDYSKGFLYASESAAEEIINSADGLQNLISEILKSEPVSVNLLEIGDPVILNMPVIGRMIGIFNGKDAIIKLEQRAVLIQGARILRGWRLAGSISSIHI